jgi:DNA (cytosine-5)-methyltransferase 1
MTLKREMAVKSATFAVVDLFAGPGGLAEGFSSVRGPHGERPFHIRLSVEKEKTAHSTLLLRAFLRQFDDSLPPEYYAFLKSGLEPDWETLYPLQWKVAVNDALLLELGLPETDEILHSRVEEVRKEHGGNTVLIGGPPCQAYSLVGRARNKGVVGYIAEDDPKHFLYESYIKILAHLKPAAFVMENVKGMLSSSINEGSIFQKILEDLRNAGDGYSLVALAPRSARQGQLLGSEPHPSDFIVRGEDFGLPQARHRVIVVGMRKDFLDDPQVIQNRDLLVPWKHRTKVEHVLRGMPKLRSGLSRDDSPERWKKVFTESASIVSKAVSHLPPKDRAEFRAHVRASVEAATRPSNSWPRSASQPVGFGARCPQELKSWLMDPRLEGLPNNETRSHMPADLARYLFAATYAGLAGTSPRAEDYPETLAPDHVNWASGKFVDRFRVQSWKQPATTVTSHLSKDGHYFIHPDAKQCRSLTVREAARLQTFPDNYLFRGNRTQQFVQVGNAVPPFLAKQIGEGVLSLLRQNSRKPHALKDPT